MEMAEESGTFHFKGVGMIEAYKIMPGVRARVPIEVT